MRQLFPRLSALVCVSFALTSPSASAGGVDTYNAPVSGSDLLQVARAHAETGHMQAFGRLSLAYNNEPLVMRNSDGSEVPIIQSQFGAYGAMGIALWHRLQVAALLSVYYQQGQRYTGQPSIDGAALGDVALDTRVAYWNAVTSSS